MRKSKRAEGMAAAILVLVLLAIVGGIGYAYGVSGDKTVTKTTTYSTTSYQTVVNTLTEFKNPPKTNLTAAFTLYGAGAAVGYHFYNGNNTLLTSGTLNSNETVVVFSNTVGRVTLTTQMPGCGICSAKIVLSDNGTVIAVGYTTANSVNNMTGAA